MREREERRQRGKKFLPVLKSYKFIVNLFEHSENPNF